MRLWADVYSAAGARQGAGPVALKAASVTRVLDGVGTVRLSAPGTDARALALLVNENHVRIYVQPTDDGVVRELGRGVIRKVRASGTPSDWTLDVDGPDELDALTRVSTKLKRTYSAETTGDIVDDLTALVSGWTASTTGGNTTDARFDAVSVLKALLGLCEQQGLHLRAGTSNKTIEVGAFGSDAGLRLVNPAQIMPGMEANSGIAFIESLDVEQDSEPVCTRLYPLGSGIGEAWLTLLNATRNTPYTRQVVNVNGIDQHFLEDFTAVAAYGVIEKMGKFNVAPLSNSAADVENAANALYDLAAAWLTRYCQRLDSYRVTAKNVRATIRPGDKVRLVYNGVVTRDGAAVNFLNVDDDFWVMECTERVGVEGAALDLVLATVDRHPQDAARVIIGSLETLSIDSVTVKPYFNQAPLVYNRVIDPVTPAIVPVRFTNAVQRVNRVLLRVKTGPFVATVLPEVTNTTHRHTIMTNDSGDRTYYWRQTALYDSASDTTAYALLPVSIESAAFSLQTGTETDEDFIGIDYGLQADTETPDTLRLFVNGTDYTASLSGPWAVGGGAATIDLDITSAIETEAGGNIQQEFEVKLTCDDGQGEIEFIVDIYNTIQAIAVT